MTEAASILQWIEDCMAQTRWWIHVQSSEEGVPPLTPPVTPQSSYTEGSSQSLFWRTSSIQSIKQRTFMEALSPTPEDHILDCAFYFRRGLKHGQQLVLISDNVTLKIKAMAEVLFSLLLFSYFISIEFCGKAVFDESCNRQVNP